jgi:sugar phosphate isomerase/epimerase
VANWAKDPRKPEDYEASLDELRRVLPRMGILGIRQIRAMSFVSVRDVEPDDPEIERNVFAKVKEMVRMCADQGVTYLHENCQNYGGLSWRHSLRLLEAVDHPNLRLVFDTGNPVFTKDRSVPEPRPRQSAWTFYEKVRQYVDRVHIKDAVFGRETGGVFPEGTHTFPGEGDGEVKKIVADLVKRDFPGALSIEPHMAVVHHDGSKKSDDEVRYETYVEYGRRLMALVKKTGED